MHRSLVALAVTTAGIVLPTAVEAKDNAPVYSVDQAVPISIETKYVTPVEIQAGPVTFVEVRVRNPPDEEEIREVTRRHEQSRPRPTITAKNDGASVAKIKIRVSFEDGNGTVFMTCDRKVSLPLGKQDDWSICGLDLKSMNTLDWPKTNTVHLVAHVIMGGSGYQRPGDISDASHEKDADRERTTDSASQRDPRLPKPQRSPGDVTDSTRPSSTPWVDDSGE